MAQPYKMQFKTHGEPAEIEQLAAWLQSTGLEATVEGPDRFGVYDVTARGAVECAEDADAAVSRWNQEHPGLMKSPDDWNPDD
jgi:hypothetical protein